MIDVIGNIKIDESKPERIKYLIACIRSYLFMKDDCRMIINLDSPSQKLRDLVNKELSNFPKAYYLEGNSNSYGETYCSLINTLTADNNFIINFFEDHFMILDSIISMKELIYEMDKTKTDVCKASFFKIEKNSEPVIKRTDGIFGNVYCNDKIFHSLYQNHYGSRFYMGVNFITTKEFALKFWSRDCGKRPHDYEIAGYDEKWKHNVMFTNVELMCSIDDNHGEDGTRLLDRTDCEKWNIIWKEVNECFTEKDGEWNFIHKEIEPTASLTLSIENVEQDVIETPVTKIKLFNIPNYQINTGDFSNLLHDKIVAEFENNFAEYVGAKYAVSFNSATSAIFLATLEMNKTFVIPSVIPPVVANALINAGNKVEFNDDVNWVGNSYVLADLEGYRIIDSAQKVERNQWQKEALNDEDLMIFSFYPTKPVGSCDGGIIVSNDKAKIYKLRRMSLNGMSFSDNNWDRVITCVGHKMYMNSIQAYIANENLKKLDQKKKNLEIIRNIYNSSFGNLQTSDHLYRIRVKDNKQFIEQAQKEGIVCGIHYEALHLNPVYKTESKEALINSERDSKQMVSIPFHEELTLKEIGKILEFIHNYKNNQ